MSHPDRVKLIKKLEKISNSRILCYVTGDRSPVSGQVGDDAVRPLMSLLREIGRVPRIDLFLYTKGGDTDVPWRIVRQLRHHVDDEWRVLIPFRANSAGTLIALGADKVVLCGEGELGPIDPTLKIQRVGQGETAGTDSISVEDVMAYVRFVRERGKLTDQSAVSKALEKLSDRVDPVSLGRIYRTHAHIRDVARTILDSRKNAPSAEIQNKIVGTLAEQVYAHGHAIGVNTAREIGLPVVEASAEEDAVMWELMQSYENDLKLNSPIDPAHAVGENDRYTEDVVIAVLETSGSGFEFSGQLDVRAKRALPQQLNVSLNLNLQLPQGMEKETLPEEQQALFQQIMQKAEQAALQQAQLGALQAIKAQAPILGADVSLRGAKWAEVQ